MPGEASGIAARGYSWPPFEAGNIAARKHGAWSPRLYQPVAAELVAGVLEQRPGLDRYRAAVAAWAELEARCLLIREHLAEVGMLDGEGEPRAAADLLLKLEGRADKARQRLGLDPRADADLAKARAEAHHAAADLDGVREAGRRALEAAERAEVVATAREGLRPVEDVQDGVEVEG